MKKPTKTAAQIADEIEAHGNKMLAEVGEMFKVVNILRGY